MNLELFLKIYSLVGQNVWLDRLGIFFARYSGYVLLIILVAVVFYFRKSAKNRLMFLEVMVSAIIARFVITQAIRLFYHHPRPFDAIGIINLIPESGWSFPSGHTTFYFAVATSVWFYNRKLGWLFLATSLTMGLARIYVGVHWPFDILGGIAVGVIVACIVHRLSLKSFGKMT